MVEALYHWLQSLFSPPVVVALLSAAPISEIRGGIPAGIFMDMPLWKVLLIGIPANVVSVIPVLLFFNWAAERLEDKPFLGRIITHMLHKARSKEEMVNKYGVWAVTLFVAVPLPVTGAWTGATVAAVFGMHLWRAVACITVGVMIASSIVIAATYGSIGIFSALSG
ncbi:MAG: COG2426 family protein [Armatimonadota bacterium]